MVAASLTLLALFGFLPVGAFLASPLESRFPVWDPANGPPDGIVVLGGGLASELSNDYNEPMLTSDGGRLTAVARLARTYPSARIVYTNGDPSLIPTGQSDTKYFYALTDSFGISRERIAVESKSRNTFENAQFSRNLINPQLGERWLLVTSAQHMPRAMGCFRQVGFAVQAYPAVWKTRLRGSFSSPDSVGAGLYQLDKAVHEWIGLVAYWLTGKTGELLPSP